MEEQVKKTSRHLSKPEIFWIAFESFFGVAGLVLIILGFIADYLQVAYSDNYLLQAQQAILQGSSGLLTFRWIGFIVLLAGALMAVITLNVFAKKRDFADEREARRAQRLKIINDSVSEEAVVDAPSKPVEDNTITVGAAQPAPTMTVEENKPAEEPAKAE